ncbi:MAG TPA: TatD family hydrolase [Rhodanobacteraceae bacterium]|nr:TatD family hydrolase [Rhodanobacteraceae bacterium]
MQLIDIGANLTHESFRRDLPDVLEHAQAAGVAQMIVTGASRESSLAARELAVAHPGVLRATAGVHPHHAGDYGADTDAALRALARTPEVVAVGETGLDYFRDLSPRSAQRAAFERQLAIAIDLGAPLFLHQRDAHADFLALLKAARDRVPGAVVHCFTDQKRALFDYLDLDCHIGITGWICDERRGAHLVELVRSIPANRLMLETDAPYLLPRDLPRPPANRRNEPAYLAHVCAAVARARGEGPDATAANATATARAFFGLRPAA